MHACVRNCFLIETTHKQNLFWKRILRVLIYFLSAAAAAINLRGDYGDHSDADRFDSRKHGGTRGHPFAAAKKGALTRANTGELEDAPMKAIAAAKKGVLTSWFDALWAKCDHLQRCDQRLRKSWAWPGGGPTGLAVKGI